MAKTTSTAITSKLTSLYSQLKSFYEDPIKNADNIRDLNSQIEALREESYKSHEEEARLKGLEYSPSEGVYRKTGTSAPKKPETNDRKAVSEYEQWQKKCLEEDITKKQWYNTEQVKAITGEDVPAGKEELKNYLSRNKNNNNLAFSYLRISEEPQDQNHFVSLNISKNGKGETEIIYLDSNGHLIRNEDRETLLKQFPDAKIMYLDQNGNKIEEGKATPENTLRVQFNDYDCGMYSGEATKMLRNAKGDAAKLRQGANELKQINSQEKRQEHSEYLHGGQARKKETRERPADELSKITKGLEGRSKPQDISMPVMGGKSTGQEIDTPG